MAPTTETGQENSEVSLPEAFTVLRETLADLGSLGRPATASEVRIGMKRRTYGGFDLKPLGFSRFRQFLNAAQDAGHVKIDEHREGDVAVELPGAIYEAAAPPVSARRIRADLWRAVSDWKHKSTHVAELSRDRVVSFPPMPVPLEPQEFADIRARLHDGDPDLVAVPPIPQDRQLKWMREFAEETSIQALKDTFVTSDPTTEFMSVVRSDADLRRAWGQVIATHAREYVMDWKAREPLAQAFDPYEPVSTANEEAEKPVPRSTTAQTSGPVLFKTYKGHDAGWTFRSFLERDRGISMYVPRQSATRDLRSMLHAAIDRMPDAELRNISIPVGYLVDED